MKLNRAAAQPARSSGHPLGSPKRRGSRRASALTLAAVLGLVVAIGPSAEAQTFTVLYSFSGYPTDGDSPIGGLFMDARKPLRHHDIRRQQQELPGHRRRLRNACLSWIRKGRDGPAQLRRAGRGQSQWKLDHERQGRPIRYDRIWG